MPSNPSLSLNERKTSSPVWGSAAAAVGLSIIFFVSIWVAGRSGLSSLLSNYGVHANQLDAVDAAIKFAPDDPESHHLRGTFLEASGELAEAIVEYRQAAQLRPDDYVLWLSLAQACELNGDPSCAIAAAREAVPLAPYYAQPHWQLGNILVRAGQTDEGFKELRLAGSSNPTLLPGVIDLAWQMSGGDVQFVMRVIAPESPAAYQALGDYFRKRGQVAEAIRNYRAAGNEAEPKRQQFLAELLGAKRFGDAYSLWSSGHASTAGAGIGVLSDPGFEQESNLDDPGFGWRRSNKAPSILLSLDSANLREGRSSLAVEFKGESDPGAPFISQLVLIAPNAHYQLAFAARTDSIVSGGLPRVVVMDAVDNQVLGSPVNLPQQSPEWQNYTIDFNSKDTTTAILISCSRASCASGPCPVFGRLWLDSFSLRKL